ncbi:MAG: microviridin/marinostatin family tricyclic proteinase inhibitor [Dolichospermum sp. DEX189]|jgi:hypothetical protein|uniref:Microviridin/marinostatin family tricyclic proteinase inhibitor n=1 Tax=Aphanizomenon flos-aquae FACHB-1040 TaxID=2692887 RepID=A0ABR8BVG3_APHFL|nr:microviridin/marinostatin family tricyclic proteinase inhibitor [Aphanizomenon flos-aquae]MBD2278667.1 microviridin/marinostatin family tricyclic proteinase inhibitor [Aphanizomenon flos-aquae FACHB-1040]MBO1068192.1 microviridin/marinostatin family tricyclic proteinase inhibitor [Dolichospermum sp. DEX189]
MTTATLTLTNIEALPFFARFLAAEEPPETPTPQPEEQPLPPPIFTFKYPSDWEDF